MIALRRHCKRVVCLVILATAPAVIAAPDFPAPPRAQVQWVSSNMVYNGRLMQVRTFNSGLPVERVLEFYRNLWEPEQTSERPGYMENDAMPPWRIISHASDDYLLTVQVRPQGNDSTGYLAVSPMEDIFGDQEPLGSGFPMMSGSKVINDIRTPDRGKDGRTLFISNEFTVSGNANYYRDHYDLRGWRVDMDETPSPGSQRVLAFSNGRQKVNIVITRMNEKTFVVANSID